MAIEAELPDGRILEFPDGTDPGVIQATVKRVLASGAAPKQSTIGSELVRGGKQLASSIRTGVEALGASPEEAARRGVARGQEIAAEAGEGVSLDAVKRAYAEKGLLSAAGEAVSQIPRALASQGAQLATMAGGARLGAMAGSAVAPGVGTVVGGALGAGATLLPQFFGSNVERQAAEQMEKGQPVSIDRTKAGAAAAGQAAIEGAGTAFVLGKRVVKGVLGIADDAALTTARAQQELVKTAQRSLTGAAGRGVVRGATEMPVEVAQQVLERAQAGLDLTSSEALAEYGEAAYQAALIGGPLGAAGNVYARGQARGQVEAQEAAQRAEEAQRARAAAEEAQVPKLPLVTAPGAQGELFGPETAPRPETPETDLRGEPVQRPKEEPEAPAAAAPQPGQEDLGLDYQREVEQLYLERERLAALPKTPEVTARIDDLTTKIRQYEEMEVAERRAQADLEAEEARVDREAQKKFPALAQAPGLWDYSDAVRGRLQGELFEEPGGPMPTEPTAAEPEPTEPTPVPPYKRTGPYQYKLRPPQRRPAPADALTMKDIEDTGIAPSTTRDWFEKNVVGKTRKDVQALVDKDPGLIEGKGKRAKILRELLAPQPATFEEAPNVPPSTETIATDERAEPGAGEPSVGVPVEPAAPVDAGPRAPVARPSRRAKAPDGLGLVPPGQPAGPGAEAQGIEPAAVDEEAARQREAAEVEEAMRKARERRPAKPAAPPPAAPRAAQPTPPISEKLYEPVGTSEFGMEEGQKEIIRGPQAMLFPMSKREEIEYAERPREEAKAAEPEAVRDERQRELDFAAPKSPISGLPVEEWANRFNYGPESRVVYADGEVALVRSFSPFGNYVYVAGNRAGRMTRVDIESYTGKEFTPEQTARLLDARRAAVWEESKRAAKAPDGPFTGAKTNVVRTDSVDQRYADYLQELMQALGLGDVRVFLLHPQDVRTPEAAAKYKLYKEYASAQTAGESENEEGSKRVFGPTGRDFYISVKPGMSENKTLEVISHELGHAIQNIAFDNADNATKAAIYKEYNDWVASTKGKTGRELVQMLRNRETADTQMLSVPEGKTAEQMSAYWTSFSEWFADNVSRWASTAEKPVSITERFFSKVAQMMRDLVAAVTGRKYPPAKSVAAFLDSMGPDSAAAWLAKTTGPVAASALKPEFSISASTEQLIDSMGPLDPNERTGLKALIPSFKSSVSPAEPDYATKFRTQVADTAATIENRLRTQFDGAVRDSLGKLNPMGLYRQAQDHAKLLLEFFQVGGLVKDPTSGLWVVQQQKGVRPPADVYPAIYAWGEKNGYDKDRATQIASRILEAVRLNELVTANPDFPAHMGRAEMAQLVREYKADPDLQALSKLMDESRIAMVDNLVKVGRLSKEQGAEWKSAVGYVPFDRIDEFAENFSKVKKISGKGLAQVGKLPELVGSLKRPVGNVFDNYVNTLGWMVGQTMKTDATVNTLRSLEDLGYAKFLHGTTQGKANTVGMYVGGEMKYWELPSKYDVLAFKDLNPPKAGWIKAMARFSNVLRKSVTALPPFALKQVTDDVQRAIMTSGVKNPGALLRMTLANFGGIAFAELRGIQHPSVRDFGKLGLTGEYDFEAGKPASSLLKDLGYKKRGKFETLLHRLDGITRASDLAVRKAIYDQTIKETNDAVLAQTRAREFINFRRRGANDFVGAMVSTIPFFNAYIQGMDVLYRAASGKDSSSSIGRAQARKMFWSRAATVMMLSSLYALGKDEDDERYQEMDLRTRDSNWIIGDYKLPVPTELGALFKVIPERVVEYMRRQGTPEEQTAWEATRTALTYIFEQYLGRTVPVPQAVKPLLEAWTNYSFFTGRELEGIYQRQQDPSMRRASNTSELAIAIANFSRDVVGVDKVSPILVDNALNGYFGSSAGLLVAMTDSLLNPTRVDRPLHKWALLSNYMYDPVGTRRMTEFYEEREKVGKANATLNELLKTDLDRAAKYAEENAEKLMLEGAVNSTLEQLERTRAYRKYLNSPDAAKEMSKEERESELQELRKMEVELTGWLREAKASLR